jgi:DNA polymerase-3 subunit delta
MRRAKQKKAQIEPQATKELTVYLGNDTRLLDNELEKLATYAREQPITVQDVHRLVSYVREESIFRFVDALGERNGSLATNLLHQLLEDSGDTSYVLYLLSMIARQFRLLIQVKELVDGRAAPPEIMRALRLNHRFILDKLLQQARNFALEQLEEIYVRLQRIDVGIKTGVAGGELALDLFIAEICASNRDKSGGS